MASTFNRHVSPKMEESIRFDSSRSRRLASKSEPNISLASSCPPVDIGRSPVWNQGPYIQRAVVKRRTDFNDAVELAKIQLTRDGWDMQGQLKLYETLKDKEQIEKLETELADVSQILIEHKNTIGALNRKLSSYRKANKELRLLASSHDIYSRSDRHNKTQRVLEEWPIKTRILRCVIALTAKDVENARIHASEALKLADALQNQMLVAECYYWQGVALYNFGRYRDAVNSLRHAALRPEVREKEVERLLTLASSRSVDQPQSPWPYTPIAKESKYSNSSAPSGSTTQPNPSLKVIRNHNNAGQHKPSRFHFMASAEEREGRQIISRRLTHSTHKGTLNVGHVEENEEESITPRASRDIPRFTDSFESQIAVEGDFAAESSSNAPVAESRSDSRVSLSYPPSLMTDDESNKTVSSTRNSLNEHSIDGQTFASIDELIEPHVVETRYPDSSSPTTLIDSPNSLDSDLLHVETPHYGSQSLAARRKANTKGLYLKVPDQHLQAIPALSKLPSAKRTAFLWPSHENQPLLPEPAAPEEYLGLYLPRNNSWGDAQSILKELGKNKDIVEGKAELLARYLERNEVEAEKWGYGDPLAS